MTMTWTERTTINPSAWSRRVEADLRRSLYTRWASETPDEELARYAQGKWSSDEITAAFEFEDALQSGFRSARAQLADTDHCPHHVMFGDEGVASLDTVDLAELNDRERSRWQNPVRGGATAPQFSATANVGSGLIPATQDTSETAPTNVTTIITGGSSGTKVEEIRFQGVGTTVAGKINVFLHDGSTYHCVQQLLITAVTDSTTATAFTSLQQYSNLIVKNGWTLKVSQTIAGNVSLVKVTGTGGDF